MAGSRRWVLVMLAGVSAVLVAASSGAVAATVITGSQIKNGTITSADLKDGTVASVDVKNRTIGQGDVAGGYVASSRVTSKTVSIAAVGAGEALLVLTHPATGLQVRYTFSGSPSLKLTNASSRPMSGSGVTSNSTTNSVQPTTFDIPGGDAEVVPSVRFGTYLVRQHRTPASASVTVTLTCARDDTTVSCTAVG